MKVLAQQRTKKNLPKASALAGPDARRRRAEKRSKLAGEIEEEQRYFDTAADRREELLTIADALIRTGDSNAAEREIRKAYEKQAQELGGPDDPVAFGRIDWEDGEALYIGRALIETEDHDPLVVSMKAPVADVFYSANVANPKGLARKRTFRTERNRIEHIDDMVFKQLAGELAALTGEQPTDELDGIQLDDSLLDELERHRSGEMAEIAKTIQASQHAIITAPHARLTVVQGGPGTGKTAVALHRLSWMLYRERETMGPGDVLVVGPNATFVRYIRQVLPDLGDRDVPQIDIKRLCMPQGLSVSRIESPEVSKLKGERRMVSLLRRGLKDRIGASETATYDFAVGRATVRFTAEELNEQSKPLADRVRVLRDGREQLRSWIARTAAGRGGVSESAIPAQQLDQFTDRIWPQLTDRAFLRELFGSRDRLLTAAGDDFKASEVTLLYRQAAAKVREETWSEADMPLLDYANRLINGSGVQYEHVVVDEAQDLSPMELVAVHSRMKNGATIVGDIAQSTGPWARDNWDDVMNVLAVGDEDELTHLELGYRVPSEVFELALQVLETAAPDVPAPRPVREGGHDPLLVEVDGIGFATEVVGRAKAHSANGNSVGIICPNHRWDSVVEALDAEVDKWVDASSGRLGGAINMIRPHDAKGLEFDAVVVADPMGIVAAYPRGARMLYVALTRTTTHLDIVHLGQALPGDDDLDEADPPAADDVDHHPELVAAEPAPDSLPSPLDQWPEPLPDQRAAEAEEPTLVLAPPNRFVDAVAISIAQDLKSALKPDQYDAVIERVIELLGSED